MMIKKFSVAGMSCSHCSNSVSTEVGAIPGVTDVAIDLAAGEVTVASQLPINDDEVATAVAAAGYEITPQVTAPIG